MLAGMAHGQDIHFTQFTMMPLQINPALAGTSESDFRAAINYKSQWGSISKPFNTYTFGADVKLLQDKFRSGSLNIGLLAFQDVAGDVNLRTTHATLIVGTTIALSEYSAFNVAIQGGILQRGITADNLQWDSQYIAGQFDPANPSFETTTIGSFVVPDLSFGLNWTLKSPSSTVRSNDERWLRLGAGIHHITQPEQKFASFFNEKLPRKLLVHGEGFYGIKGESGAIMPRFMVATQGPYREIVLGALYRISLREFSQYTGFIREAALSLGANVRLGDAFAPVVRLEVGDFMFGIELRCKYIRFECCHQPPRRLRNIYLV